MPIKLGNNASAHLAAPLAADGTSIVLVSGEMTGFPVLAAGDWFPMTLTDSAGRREIVRVTGRAANTLTATRAQEGTTALAWLTGDRAEIRLTANIIGTLQSDTTQVASDLAQAETDLTTSLTALMESKDAARATAAASLMDSKDNALASTLRSEMAGSELAGTMKMWILPTEPAGWIFADGRTLTGTSALRTALINASFPHGQDGSGNPKIIDMRGNVPAAPDNVNGAAGRLTGATLGALLGAEAVALTTAHMPSHNHTASATSSATSSASTTLTAASNHAHSDYYETTTLSENTNTYTGISFGKYTGGGDMYYLQAQGAGANTTTGAAGAHTHPASTSVTTSVSTNVTVDNNGSGAAHPNVQPTRICHFIIKL